MHAVQSTTGTVPAVFLSRYPDQTVVVFCDAACMTDWIFSGRLTAPPPFAVVHDGPAESCMWCHACGRRVWTGEDCPFGDDCPDERWECTWQAAIFLHELHQLLAGHPAPDNAEVIGQGLCATGYPPAAAARTVLGLPD